MGEATLGALPDRRNFPVFSSPEPVSTITDSKPNAVRQSRPETGRIWLPTARVQQSEQGIGQVQSRPYGESSKSHGRLKKNPARFGGGAPVFSASLSRLSGLRGSLNHLDNSVTTLARILYRMCGRGFVSKLGSRANSRWLPTFEVQQ
jgi:hypothetical protein